MGEGGEELLYCAEMVSVWPYLGRTKQWSLTGADFENNLKLQKGVSGARADDTKSLKGAILDWIVPRGQPLDPPLSRTTKSTRGFNHERTGALLCPEGTDWTLAE